MLLDTDRHHRRHQCEDEEDLDSIYNFFGVQNVSELISRKGLDFG